MKYLFLYFIFIINIQSQDVDLESLKLNLQEEQYYYLMATASYNDFLEPRQGKVFLQLEILYGKDFCAMDIIYSYEQNVKYFPKDKSDYEGIDYHPNGSLIIWRPQRKYELSNNKRNEALKLVTNYKVSPEGNIKFNKQRHAKYIFPIGGKRNVYIASQLFLALGKDLPSKSILGPETNNRFPAKFSGFDGSWKLEISDNLVRTASFSTTDKNIDFNALFKNSGIMKAENLTLAQNGFYSIGDYMIKFDLQELEFTKDINFKGLYKRVLAQMDKNLPDNLSTILDYREKDPYKMWTHPGENKKKVTAPADNTPKIIKSKTSKNKYLMPLVWAIVLGCLSSIIIWGIGKYKKAD